MPQKQFMLTLTLVVVSLSTYSDQSHAQTENDADEKWLCALDLQTHQSRKLFTLKHLAYTGSIDVTQDGTKLAISGTADPKDADEHHIWVCRLDGSEMTDIGIGKSPSWSPRGKRLAYMKEISGGAGVWVAQADGSNEQLIDDSGQCAQWSPDGLRIAYTRPVNGRPNIVMFNIPEDEYSTVFPAGDTRYDSIFWKFSWSPDSKRICIKGETRDKLRDLASVSIKDSRQITVHAKVGVNHPCEFCWLDQHTIVVVRSLNESSVLQMLRLDTNKDSDTPEFIPLAGQFENRNNYAMDVTGDGKTLVYLSGPNK